MRRCACCHLDGGALSCIPAITCPPQEIGAEEADEKMMPQAAHAHAGADSNGTGHADPIGTLQVANGENPRHWPPMLQAARAHAGMFPIVPY